ncbi:hypothetical protein CBR_g52133 [Chara braunii]|uniref:CAAX prenyl protease 2/Lysostaphin resistance protein A-like domain-containing protein n=1 Tax=Chara braunii TaxID=69332 RepID=A0A388M9J1_CHABU|nr:hypothetical protein CBR_g52133 [Chara braunii]|eukprot:GBG91247.1 hypothetical protein CBR_g52133 [Chara braunii]
MFGRGAQAVLLPVQEKLCSGADGGLVFASVLQRHQEIEGSICPLQCLSTPCKMMSAHRCRTQNVGSWNMRPRGAAAHDLPSCCSKYLLSSSPSHRLVADGQNRPGRVHASSVRRYDCEIGKGCSQKALQNDGRENKGHRLKTKWNCRRVTSLASAASAPGLASGQCYVCSHCRMQSLQVGTKMAVAARELTSVRRPPHTMKGQEVAVMLSAAAVGSRSTGSVLVRRGRPGSSQARSPCSRSASEDGDIISHLDREDSSQEGESPLLLGVAISEKEGEIQVMGCSENELSNVSNGPPLPMGKMLADNERLETPSPETSNHEAEVFQAPRGGEEVGAGTEGERQGTEEGKTADASALQPAGKIDYGELWHLHRWSIPWSGGSTALGMVGWLLSFVVTGYGVTLAAMKLGLTRSQLNMDPDAQALFLLVNQSVQTIVGVLAITLVVKPFEPLPEDLFVFDVRRPRFRLKDGWLLWAGIGLAGAVVAVQVSSQVVSFFHGGEMPPREKNEALMQLLPLIGVSGTTTFSLLTVTGACAPLLEEFVFRGFLMTSLTKWLPTSLAIVLSASAFAMAHFTPAEFPQLFSLGLILGFSYARTRNLLTPMIIHSLWNSSVILLLTLLHMQGYNISEFLNQ